MRESSTIYQQYGIYDRTPEGIVQHIRREIGRAGEALDAFRFAEARQHIHHASVIATTLHMDLEKDHA